MAGTSDAPALPTAGRPLGGLGLPVPRGRAAVAAGALGCVLLAGLIVQRPWLITGAVLGSALLVLALMRPLVVVGVMLLIGLIDLSFVTGGFKGLFAGLGGLDMNGIRLLGLTASFLAIAAVDREVLRHAVGRHGRWYLAFLAFATATLVYSDARMHGVRLLLKLAYPFLIFVVVLGVARTRAELTRLADWALAGATAVAVLNPLYVMSGGYYVDLSGRLRLLGFGAHQNPFSFYLLIMMLVAFARFTVRGQKRYLLLSAALGMWVVLTVTRIALGATMVALAAAALYDAIVTRRWRTLVGAAVVGAVIAVPLVPAALERSLGFVPTAGELLILLADPMELYRAVDWAGRQVIWPVLANAFLASPLLGHGLGSSTVVVTDVLGWMSVPHNEYLRLGVDTGIIGGALFALAILVWLAGVVRAGRSQDPLAREFALPAFAGILAWAVIAATDNAFDYYASFTQYIGFLCAGALACGGAVERDEETHG